MMCHDIETLGPWTAHIEAMDQTLAGSNLRACVGAWRQAYSAALSDPGWRGLLTVANAARRLCALRGLAGEATAWARETYWIALFRARQQRSLDGVLSAAAAFEQLGDHVALERSVRVAEVLATQTGEVADAERLRVFMERRDHQSQMAQQEL
jgi:hypothetical protein